MVRGSIRDSCGSRAPLRRWCWSEWDAATRIPRETADPAMTSIAPTDRGCRVPLGAAGALMASTSRGLRRVVDLCRRQADSSTEIHDSTADPAGIPGCGRNRPDVRAPDRVSAVHAVPPDHPQIQASCPGPPEERPSDPRTPLPRWSRIHGLSRIAEVGVTIPVSCSGIAASLPWSRGVGRWQITRARSRTTTLTRTAHDYADSTPATTTSGFCSSWLGRTGTAGSGRTPPVLRPAE